VEQNDVYGVLQSGEIFLLTPEWLKEWEKEEVIGMRKTKKAITYHGRTGRPEIHTAKSGRRYIMVRAKGGGVKRLYEGSKYTENGKVRVLSLK